MIDPEWLNESPNRGLMVFAFVYLLWERFSQKCVFDAKMSFKTTFFHNEHHKGVCLP